jgi:hypothetical protein
LKKIHSKIPVDTYNPIVRYRQIKTTPHVEKKDLLEIQTAGLRYTPDLGAVTWVNWVVGFIGGAKSLRRERVSGL